MPDLYLIGLYKADEFQCFMTAQMNVRVYKSITSAKKRIGLEREYYGVRGIELRILKINSMEEVKINE